MWKGSISFGLVNIPIKMFASTENKDIRFKYIHAECGTPLKNVRTCPACNREISWEETARGYEYEPGRFVVLKDDDLGDLSPEATKTIDIIDFVSLAEIDPIYFDKTYYLSPQDTGSKAYVLLQKAMNDTGKIAIAKISIRTKQSLAAVRVYKNLLVLETIFYPDEIRSVDLVPGVPQNTQTDSKELDMAVRLIDNLTAVFDPAKYTDDYRQALQELLNKKIEDQEVQTAPARPQNNIVDLMKALQASIEQTRAPGTKTKKTAKTKDQEKVKIKTTV
jgi:DNA end-binding protein Ku